MKPTSESKEKPVKEPTRTMPTGCFSVFQGYFWGNKIVYDAWSIYRVGIENQVKIEGWIRKMHFWKLLLTSYNKIVGESDTENFTRTQVKLLAEFKIIRTLLCAFVDVVWVLCFLLIVFFFLFGCLCLVWFVWLFVFPALFICLFVCFFIFLQHRKAKG